MATQQSTSDVLVLANAAASSAGAQAAQFWADTYGHVQSFAIWTIQAIAGAAISVTIEGSLDGVNWVTITGGTNPVVAAGVSSIGTAGKVFPYIRANVGAGATVTVLAVGVGS